MVFRAYREALLNLFFPRLCGVCGNTLVSGEQHICSVCLYHFPYDPDEHSKLRHHFCEVCTVPRIYTLFRYNKDSDYRHLIYGLKYNQKKELGIYLGAMLGARIEQEWDKYGHNPAWCKIDAVVPLPLHPKREKKRGYNQAVLIARGISDVLNVPVRDQWLRRIVNNPSQTQLSVEQRALNVDRIFALSANSELQSLHILLVDDVITTGATIKSCLELLGEVPGLKVSVASLAHTGV